ncbi:hypothetical protein Srufu_070320 [Streptomyces libani subsp. rufus]|nr:hypothetical protein Srufu_070320 [Streptomyces libani subsp. rufus]
MVGDDGGRRPPGPRDWAAAVLGGQGRLGVHHRDRNGLKAVVAAVPIGSRYGQLLDGAGGDEPGRCRRTEEVGALRDSLRDDVCGCLGSQVAEIQDVVLVDAQSAEMAVQ